MRLNGWHHAWTRRRADLAALTTISLFFVCFFPKVLFGHRFVIAGDAYYYSYPLRTVAWRMIRNGELPLWTPHLLSGYPLLAMSQVAIGYPLTWVYLFVHGPWAEQICVLAPFLLTPIFMYAYIRELGLSRMAALFAGLAFGYGGMMCSFIANSGLLTNSLMWMPLLLLFIDRAQRRSFAHCLTWATVVYAMSVLAGHGQSYVYIGVLAISYGLFLFTSAWLQGPLRERWRWKHWRPLVVAFGAVLLSAGIAAFQLLETLQAARLSIRSELSYKTFGEGSFTLREALLSIGAPLYHYVDTSGYVAPLALVCVPAAIIWSARGRIHDVRVWFWLGVAVVAFVLMLGTNTPVYRVIYQLPVLNQFRVASRHSFEWTLALSILSAFGWDALESFVKDLRRTSASKAQAMLIIALFLLTLFVGVMWWRAANVPP
ncbi:MAG TPA: hypothetical protein VIW64_06830, partial [Pyrinomonadaceae bacterium]